MKIIQIIINKLIRAVTVFVLLIACGSPTIEIDNSKYEPKIVISGLLNPNLDTTVVTISRNFPIGQTIDKSQIYISDAQVYLTNTENESSEQQMTFFADSGYYILTKEEFEIENSKSYRLDVIATIDGEELSATSTTTIPATGFEIIEGDPRDLFYRQMDLSGAVIMPKVQFMQTTGVSMYMLSSMASDTSDENFVYENPMGLDIKKMREDGAVAKSFQYGTSWKLLEDLDNQTNVFELNWFRFWYYGEYRFILYACDENYYHYAATHANIMDADGNLYEPKFDIDGDGIGLFGSVITDTTWFNIKKLP